RGRLTRAILDIFDKECRVDLAVAGDQEKRIQALREENEAISRHLYTIHELDHPDQAEKKPARENHESKPRTVRPRTPKEPEKPRDPTVPEMTDNAIGKPIIGRAIADHPMEMKGLNSELGLVVVQGDIFKFETKELKGGEMLLVTFAVTDYTSSILCKVFMRYRRSAFGRQKLDLDEHPITEEERNAVMEKVNQIKLGMNVKVRGECLYDNFAHELTISVRDMVPMEKIEREDKAAEKRIELHLHTNMSTLDALSPAEDLIGRAVKWGHPAIAITDHGVLQSFPAAFKAAKGKIKLIPGCEGYLIDDPVIVRDPAHRSFDEPIIVLDFETTGLNTGTCRAIEIGAVRLVRGAIEDSLSILINPHVPIPPKVAELTGITDNMLADKESAETVIPKLMEFIGDAPIAAHNAAFDSAVLHSELRRLGLTWQGPVLDTLAFARKLYPDMKTHKLGTLCKRLGVSLKNAHRAVHDATATAHCLARMYDECKEKGMHYLDELDEQLKGGAIGESYHIILLAKNQTGLVNLNRLVSISHLDYFRRRPHMPRKIIQKYREGLILGSACEAGELFRAVLRQDPWDKLKEMASFYDYLEIQPIGNNAFLIREGQVPDEDALRDLNRQIVRLGDELGIPVVATGDVHFMDPHNAINRAIIQAGMGYEDCDHQPPLYFKTTDEMLEEFNYLGPEKCHEVVIDNPHKIADMVEPLRLFPKHPKDEDTFQPVWEDAADNIQNMTWSTAKEMYGDPLPEIVLKRLEKELKSIVGYGYCTLYNIAEKLVTKSLEDG
ncbi:MAG: PHP domain-containing protein, partial [Clostridia bacterium]|nr:PHP domain-containing protein [Clostridia bacterium]